MFTRNPISLKNGSIVDILPISRYNGEPGGCITDKVWEHAINSPQSQNEVVGATVRKYVKILYQKGFIVRRIVEEKRLKYVYEAIPIRKTWAKLKRDIGRIMTEIGKTLRTIT